MFAGCWRGTGFRYRKSDFMALREICQRWGGVLSSFVGDSSDRVSRF